MKLNKLYVVEWVDSERLVANWNARTRICSYPCGVDCDQESFVVSNFLMDLSCLSV